MNKLKICIVCAVIAVTGRMAAQSMTFGDVDLKEGETDTVKISMTNPMPISAWQMKFYLPKGLSIAKNATNGNWLFSLSSRHSRDFVYGISPSADEPLPEDGCFTILCFPKNSAFISSGEGELCSITFKADQNYSKAESILVKEIHLSDRTAKNISLGDVFISNEPSGIRNIEIENKNVSSTIYSISGQRVTGTPHKGIYIQNGKKVIIK